MKLSDLRPCDNCGGKLTGEEGRNIQFYVLRCSMALLNSRAINQVMGMHLYFQRQSLPLAEIFAPESDQAIELLAEQKEAGGWNELQICFDCATGIKKFNLLMAVENREEAKEKAKSKDSPGVS